MADLGAAFQINMQERISLRNLADWTELEIPQDPEISGTGPVNYTEEAPIGGSAGYLDYGSAANQAVQLVLPYHRLHIQHTYARGKNWSAQDSQDFIQRQWAWLQAMRVPYAQPDGWLGGEARALWLDVPSVLSWRCRLTDLSWGGLRRDVPGRIMSITFRITLKEDPYKRWTAQEVAERGGFRW